MILIAIAILFVLGSGFLHALWNLYAKKSSNTYVFLWLCQWVAIIVLLPWFLLELKELHIPGIGFILIFISMLLHALYVLLLAAAYTVGDLSKVYPIIRGTSPLLVPIIGVVFLNEYVSIYGWIGIVLIVIGIVFLSEIRIKGTEPSSLKVTLLALSVGVTTTSYIIVDKMTLEYVNSPAVLNQAINIGNLLALSWATFNSGGIRKEWSVNWRTILLGGILAPTGYLLFLFALSVAPVSQLSPIREIGIVFGTLLAIFILKEPQDMRRIVSSILITFGVIILGIWG